ncbi:MAG: ATP-dependent DNA helicase [Ahniella sp.]|nr:ATP-dependent DNA helicase [Ahniella sp.]
MEAESRTPAEIALDHDGALAAAIAGFRVREVQISMARAIEDTIEHHSELVVEAGTGTGKTFAYLVPALQSGVKVIVSTGTKALQDQLFHRDLPRVRKALGSRAKLALLKGRANYLCRDRLDKTRKEGNLHSRVQVAELVRIHAWAGRSVSGDIAEMDTVPEDSPIWPRVTSTSENCLGSDCPQFNECFVVRARRAAQEADLVVVNHHLLFADLAIRREGFGEILPGANVFIIDEAHQIPELAGQFFGESVSTRQLSDLRLDAEREAAAVAGTQAALKLSGANLDLACRDLRLALHGQPARAAWATVANHDEVRRALDDIRHHLSELHQQLASLAEASPGLESCRDRAELLANRLDLTETLDDRDHIVWYEYSERNVSITSTPLDVAKPLSEFRQRLKASWVFTSATLSVGKRFDHFTRAIGLWDPETLLLPSPFDYPRQALMYLPPSLPAPNSFEHTSALVEAVRPVLAASGGRAFLLFTSHRALKRAAELLADLPFPLFVQGTATRTSLLEQFRQSGNGVLLGAASFWEGVDVQGDALSVVVIDKLPFAPPDDPVLDARIQRCKDEGGNPFGDIQIPNAAIAMKQGAGRLIRDAADRGVLMLGDPRLTASSYGRIFLNSLPPMRQTRSLADVQAFFASHAPVIENDADE